VDTEQEWEFREVDCAVCGGQSFRVLGFHGGEAHRAGVGVRTRIVRCRTCSLILANPMPFPAGEDRRYRDVADYFDGVWKASEEARAGDDILATAESLLGYRGKMLDIGCGTGAMVRAAADRAWDAEGCDISGQFVRHAVEVVGVKARRGTLEELCYPAESFDAVMLVEVIEHLYDPRAAMREVYRILRPGGIAYVSTPNEASLYQVVGNLYYRVRRQDWCVNLCPTWNLYHVLGFSPRSLERLLGAEGFRVERLVCYPGSNPVPRRPGLVGRAEAWGARAVAGAARVTGLNPYMFAWARKAA
jgi:SAM-dependent methyltransferase